MEKFKNFAKKFRQNKKALSPAIAIALLLSITIALVAAVGYSATVVTPSVSTTTPQGIFNVNIYKDSGVVIKEISGDKIASSDLTFKFVANGVETVVNPAGNNTIYLNWAVFNPGLWTNGTNPNTWGRYLGISNDYFELNEADGNTYYIGPEFELNNTDGSPKPVTGVGVQITDALFPIIDHATIELGTSGITFDHSITVELGNKTDSDSFVVATALDGYSTTMDYREVWHNVTSPYVMYYVDNPDNTTYNQVRVTREGCTFTIDVPMQDRTDQPLLSKGHALYLRLSEYNSPFLWSASVIPTRDLSASFGAYTISPGTVLQSVGPAYSSYGVFGHQALISNWNDLASGDKVQVYIIYTPSNTVVWQGDVFVQ
jgi:hypothetical protein